jgi:hypothetical protein
MPKEWADKYKGKFDQGWDKSARKPWATVEARRHSGGLSPHCTAEGNSSVG